MSRSIHQNYKTITKGKSKAELNEMFSENDPDVEALAKKRIYKKDERRRRKGEK